MYGRGANETPNTKCAIYYLLRLCFNVFKQALALDGSLAFPTLDLVLIALQTDALVHEPENESF